MPASAPPAPRRLYVHVGLQKTGTSFLQAAMLRSREDLAAAGVDLVPPTKREAFELMVVVRDRYAARRDAASDARTWARFRTQLAQAPGTRAVLSQESLAAAGPRQVERLLAACGDREVHVVATVRDLGRQLPSAWQEELKAGGTATFAEHLARLQRLEAAGAARLPWIHLDAPQVLRRWSASLPPEHVHVVTVPPAGSPPTALLERFARVLEVDPALLRPEERPANTGLGHAQAEVLRRVNAELPEEAHRRYVYGDLVKRSFGRQVLAAQGGRRILAPASVRPWAEEVAARQVEALAAAGYHVEGDLEDLRCRPEAFGPDDPDGGAPDGAEPTEAEVAAASVGALATLLGERGKELARRRDGRIGGPDRAPGAAVRGRLRGVRRAAARLRRG